MVRSWWTRSQDGVSQQQGDAPLSIPQLNRLYEASSVRGEDASNAAVTAIPAQNKVTLQILRMWQPFRGLKLMLAVSRRSEQLRLRSQQRIVATVEDSVLRTEMAGLESQEEDSPKRVLHFKPMSWLGQIRTHRRDEAWSASLWRAFFATSMGAQIPVIAKKPLSACGCKKFQVDALGDHLCTCTAHSGVKKAHDWAVDQIADLFRTLACYLANAAGLVPWVLDLRIAHDRFGSSSDPSLNGHLNYPNDIRRSLNEAAADKIRRYRADYNSRSSNVISFMPAIPSTSGRFIVHLCAIYSRRLIGKLITFLQLQEFSLRNMTVNCSTSAARRSPHSSSLKWAAPSPRLQLYVLTSTLTGRL